MHCLSGPVLKPVRILRIPQNDFVCPVRNPKDVFGCIRCASQGLRFPQLYIRHQTLGVPASPPPKPPPPRYDTGSHIAHRPLCSTAFLYWVLHCASHRVTVQRLHERCAMPPHGAVQGQNR